jgi:hypothetical protein
MCFGIYFYSIGSEFVPKPRRFRNRLLEKPVKPGFSSKSMGVVPGAEILEQPQVNVI